MVTSTNLKADRPYRAMPDRGTVEDVRRALDRTNERIDVAMRRLDRLEAVDRVTSATTLTDDHRVVLVNTDSAAVPIALPAGVAGRYYRIVNTGTSGNDVTITPDGSEDLIGVNTDFILADGEAMIIAYDVTDGWY